MPFARAKVLARERAVLADASWSAAQNRGDAFFDERAQTAPGGAGRYGLYGAAPRGGAVRAGRGYGWNDARGRPRLSPTDLDVLWKRFYLAKEWLGEDNKRRGVRLGREHCTFGRRAAIPGTGPGSGKGAGPGPGAGHTLTQFGADATWKGPSAQFAPVDRGLLLAQRKERLVKSYVPKLDRRGVPEPTPAYRVLWPASLEAKLESGALRPARAAVEIARRRLRTARDRGRPRWMADVSFKTGAAQLGIPTESYYKQRPALSVSGYLRSMSPPQAGPGAGGSVDRLAREAKGMAPDAPPPLADTAQEAAEWERRPLYFSWTGEQPQCAKCAHRNRDDRNWFETKKFGGPKLPPVRPGTVPVATQERADVHRWRRMLRRAEERAEELEALEGLDAEDHAHGHAHGHHGHHRHGPALEGSSDDGTGGDGGDEELGEDPPIAPHLEPPFGAAAAQLGLGTRAAADDWWACRAKLGDRFAFVERRYAGVRAAMQAERAEARPSFFFPVLSQIAACDC